MRALLATALLLALTALCLAGSASAAPPVPVYSCNFLTKPCWNGALACVAISEQVPQCVKDPGVIQRPQAVHLCVTEAFNTDGSPASCAGLVCFGYGGSLKCYGQPIPPCINICV